MEELFSYNNNDTTSQKFIYKDNFPVTDKSFRMNTSKHIFPETVGKLWVSEKSDFQILCNNYLSIMLCPVLSNVANLTHLLLRDFNQVS